MTPVDRGDWARYAEAFGVALEDVAGLRRNDEGVVQFRLVNGTIVQRLDGRRLLEAGADRLNEAGAHDRRFIPPY